MLENMKSKNGESEKKVYSCGDQSRRYYSNTEEDKSTADMGKIGSG